jgi:hypothetical protein
MRYELRMKTFSRIGAIFLQVIGYGFAAAVLWFTYIMLTKVLPYMSFERAINFLGTKPDETLDKQHFMIAFYLHITSSLWVMGLGVLQFVPFVMRRFVRFHRISGFVYLVSVLVLAAPSGLVLAAYANGGLTTRVGFSLQCVVWWVVTLLAWVAIAKRQYVQHSEMMLRSYAVTLAAMSLRTQSYFMVYVLYTRPIETYQTVTWLSWVGNLLLIETFIYLGLGKYLIAHAMKKPKAV